MRLPHISDTIKHEMRCREHCANGLQLHSQAGHLHNVSVAEVYAKITCDDIIKIASLTKVSEMCVAMVKLVQRHYANEMITFGLNREFMAKSPKLLAQASIAPVNVAALIDSHRSSPSAL